MKNKKIILAIVSIILIAILTTVSFAANNTRTGMTFDEAVQASRERNNTLKNEVINVVENEVVEETQDENVVEEPAENTVDNTVLDESLVEDETLEDEIPSDEIIEEKEDETNEIEEEATVTFLETISKDIVNAGDDIKYNAVYVDGNVHIMADNVVLKDFKVDGNLFVLSTNVEFDNVIVDGSCYICAETAKVDGQITSAYIIADNLTMTAFANIIKELRVVSSNFDFEGFVGRDLYAYTENIIISDRAEIYGDCIIETGSMDISEDAKINGEKKIEIVENVNTGFSIDNKYVYNSIIANCVIILVVAIFVLYSSPKFVAVNGKLRLRDFIKAFFTGILELIIVFAIFMGLAYIGYGFGFGFALLILSFILVYFGKMIFIISAGIRLAGKSEDVSKVKSFFMILIVLAAIEAINLLQLTGVVGLIASMIINVILGITGFGSLVRVVLTPSRKKKQVKPVQNNNVREVRPDDFVIQDAPVVEEEKEIVAEPQEIKEEEVQEKVEETNKNEDNISKKDNKKEKNEKEVKTEESDKKEDK